VSVAAVERILPKRLVKPDAGDIVPLREAAGRLVSASMWRYRLVVSDERRSENPVFARHESAIAQAEELASRRKLRLFSVEDGAAHLLMDYRLG
jgi:hypothetical protein